MSSPLDANDAQDEWLVRCVTRVTAREGQRDDETMDMLEITWTKSGWKFRTRRFFAQEEDFFLRTRTCMSKLRMLDALEFIRFWGFLD